MGSEESAENAARAVSLMGSRMPQYAARSPEVLKICYPTSSSSAVLSGERVRRNSVGLAEATRRKSRTRCD